MLLFLKYFIAFIAIAFIGFLAVMSFIINEEAHKERRKNETVETSELRS